MLLIQLASRDTGAWSMVLHVSDLIAANNFFTVAVVKSTTHSNSNLFMEFVLNESNVLGKEYELKTFTNFVV